MNGFILNSTRQILASIIFIIQIIVGKTIIVDQGGNGDYTTISAAVSAASANDTVLVHPGTNYENINPNGKDVVITSNYIIDQDSIYISQTIIDGRGNTSYSTTGVITYGNNESNASQLIGLSGAEFKVDYDPSMFQIESVTQGALFQSGTQSIFHVDYNNDQGSFSVLTAILDATTPSVDGTGVLAEVVVKLLNQGTNNLSFGNTNKLRDPDNIEIAIREKIGGIVIAQ